MALLRKLLPAALLAALATEALLQLCFFAYDSTVPPYQREGLEFWLPTFLTVLILGPATAALFQLFNKRPMNLAERRVWALIASVLNAVAMLPVAGLLLLFTTGIESQGGAFFLALVVLVPTAYAIFRCVVSEPVQALATRITQKENRFSAADKGQKRS